MAARPGRWTLARVYDFFPALAERRRNRGNELSGGEQQMLSIGRALMGNPTLLLMDEPLEGLAPVIVEARARRARPAEARGRSRHPAGRAACAHRARIRRARDRARPRPHRLFRSQPDLAQRARAARQPDRRRPALGHPPVAASGSETGASICNRIVSGPQFLFRVTLRRPDDRAGGEPRLHLFWSTDGAIAQRDEAVKRGRGDFASAQ